MYVNIKGTSGVWGNSVSTNGGPGGNAIAINPGDAASLSNSALATGGVGGQGEGGFNSSVGNGGQGGDAVASAYNGVSGSSTSSSARAFGGEGGIAGIPQSSTIAGGFGGAGGTATATSIGKSASGTLRVSAGSYGGAGGRSPAFSDTRYPGKGTTSGAGGAGGIASGTIASGTSSGGGNVYVSAGQVGGPGGYASYGAPGGAGASTTLTNAVSGSTSGQLSLVQLAGGGSSGPSKYGTAGPAGNATSSLTVTDNLASALYGRSSAFAGHGSVATSGGSGVASIGLTGQTQVKAVAYATGGDVDPTVIGVGSGSHLRSPVAVGGNATATSNSTATSTGSNGTATALATARSGSGLGNGTSNATAMAATANGQLAQATAQGNGSSGLMQATATTAGIGLVKSVTASASAQADGLSTYLNVRSSVADNSKSDLLTSADPKYHPSYEPGAVSRGSIITNPSSVSTMLASHSNVRSVLGGVGAVVFGAGVQSSNYAQTTASTLEYISTVAFTLDGTQVFGHLVLGLLDGVAIGVGFQSLRFTANVGNAQIIDQTFTTASAAQAFFSNNAVDLGKVQLTPSLTVSFTLDLVGNGGTGFDEDFVLGATAAALFTDGDNVVDFNALTPIQAAAVRNGAQLYNALGGNDTITLPDDTHAANLVAGTGASLPYVLNSSNPAYTFHAGSGADTFDFTKDQKLNSYAAGETLYIDGDTPATGASATAPYSTSALNDTLKLPGAPGDYTFTVNYTGTLAGTHTVVSRNPVTSAGPATPVNINTADIERATFTATASNTVKLYTPHASIPASFYGEVAELNTEVYGPSGIPHLADALASSNSNPSQNLRIGDQAVARGWHEVSAMELGLAPADFGSLPGLSYSFANGFYQGQPSSLPGGQEDALVLTGLVNGTRTLMVTIRGTDEASDFLDYASFLNSAFPKLAPLFGAVQAYAQDASNGIQRVVVTGHSLGGGLAQLFASKLQVPAQVDVFTFGSPGAEALGAVSPASTPNQINFVHTDDPVATAVPGATQSQVVKALFGTAASALLPSMFPAKSRNGYDVGLNSDASNSKLSLAEHRMGGYQADINKLIAYANDPVSSFRNDPFADALRSGKVYSSALPQIAIGTGTSAGGTMHVDAADKYVLGDLGADDEIVWRGAYGRLKNIDGGGAGSVPSGSKQGDTLTLTTGVWDWQVNGDHYDLYKAPSPASTLAFVGTLRRINTIVTSYQAPVTLSQSKAALAASAASVGTQTVSAAAFAPFDPARLVTHLDGVSTTVQRAAALATTLTADGLSDVTYAGPGVTRLTSNASHAVLVYAGDVSTVSVTGGEATIISDGSVGGIIAIDTGNTTSTVIGGVRAEAIAGHLAGATFQGGSGDSTVSYAGVRSDYLLTTMTDGSTNVSDLSGFGGDTLTNIGHVTFSDQTIDLTTTLIADLTPSFAMTDVTAAISSTTIGEDYAGPVSYLQKQFIYTGADKVAVAAQAGNVFLKGSTGDDALAASSGSNVLDGGLGSNFLVGADGSDGGTDTFYVDGRDTGVTWSTVVNFHHGDAVTFWGFSAGTSTMPWTAQEGAQGYQGATIHAELAGAGTGVNASVTFANISLADAQSKLTTSTGSVGGNSYLQITYTG